MKNTEHKFYVQSIDRALTIVAEVGRHSGRGISLSLVNEVKIFLSLISDKGH